MLKLFFNEKKISSGTVPVSWCFDKEDIKNVLDIGNPVICICIIKDNPPKYSIPYYIIAPLKDLITYVPLRFKGKCKIFACIMPRSMINYDLGFMYYGVPMCTLADINENVIKYSVSGRRFIRSEIITVDVPEECFAKEPPQWEQNWVNMFFWEKPQDKCQYRRRRIFAYTLQPIMYFAIVSWFVFCYFLITLSSLLLGKRNFSLKPLLNPVNTSAEEAFKILKGGSWFIGKGKSKFWNYARLLISPISLLLIGLITVLCINNVISLLSVFWTILFIAGVLLSLRVMLFAFAYLFTMPEDQCYIDDLVMCDNASKLKDINDLPSKNKTIKLRYLDLKSKVCKPFSE